MAKQNIINVNTLNPLAAEQGGTGTASPTDHAILVGQGSDPIVGKVLGQGELLIGTTSGDPVAATLTAGSGVTITEGEGSITITAGSSDLTPYLRYDTTKNVVVGYTATAEDLGDSGTSTVTPTIATGSIKTLNITGSFTLAAPTDTESGYIEIEATNDSTGGYTVIMSAFTQISGAYESGANLVNIFRISKINSNCYLEIAQPL